VCIHIYACMCMYTRVNVLTYVCMQCMHVVCVHVCIYVCIFVLCTYVRMYTCTYVGNIIRIHINLRNTHSFHVKTQYHTSYINVYISLLMPAPNVTRNRRECYTVTPQSCQYIRKPSLLKLRPNNAVRSLDSIRILTPNSAV
jgi:flagellar biosynthesis protein FliQ